MLADPVTARPADKKGCTAGRTTYPLYGAADRNRTCNLMITNHLLCQLSYEGKCFLSVFYFSDQGFQTTPPPFPGTPSALKSKSKEGV